MPGRPSATVRDLRRANRARALWALYLRGPLSRQQIGDAAGVSLATVSNVVGELLEQGVLIEVGLVDSNGGRPRGLVRVAPGYGFVLGVDIGETEFLVELYDLSMTVRAAHRSSTQLHRLEPADALTHVVAGIEHVLSGAEIDRERILGVGIGVPGLVEHPVGGRGAVVHGQSIGWDAVPFEELLGEKLLGEKLSAARTDLPLLIDNGAKTLGQAETWFGAARHVDNAVIALLGIGVGTSIVSNRELYRGATSSAGEWGHTTIVADGRACRCGARGCLEAYVGATAISERYARLRGRDRLANPADLEHHVGRLIAERAADPAAAQVVAETVGYLGAGIANLINMFNPARVVVGGWLGRALTDAVLPEVRAAAARNALHLPFSQVEIVPAELGVDAVALGAATLPVAGFLSSGAPVRAADAGPQARRRPD